MAYALNYTLQSHDSPLYAAVYTRVKPDYGSSFRGKPPAIKSTVVSFKSGEDAETLKR